MNEEEEDNVCYRSGHPLGTNHYKAKDICYVDGCIAEKVEESKYCEEHTATIMEARMKRYLLQRR